ncbi:uncharacterized protein LOC122388723 [Amphibalanus amphitrite]|uniref:uncharacterized protein LOC122388723 n=1 Tax=Amphibalanus amphitrite TaxID=1232801 RepID=UPI001C90B455|nr:uncharacterized protein LOC122388723 [Amphibalanus amphitrite]
MEHNDFMDQESKSTDVLYDQKDFSECDDLNEVRQLVQFSRAEVRSEHVWLERLSLPCVLETALETLASLPDSQLLAAAEAAQLPAALGSLPAAARAGPLPALLRRLSGVGSEPALRLAADMFWDLYTADVAPVVERCRCLLASPALLERLTLTAIGRRELTPLARLAAASEPLSARLFRLVRAVFESSGGCGAAAALAAQLASDVQPQLPPGLLQAPAASLVLSDRRAPSRLETLTRRRRGSAHVRWLAALYPDQMRTLCTERTLYGCPRLRRLLAGAQGPVL